MPVQIGTRAPHFSDPTALMADCHRRIEMFLGTLLAISRLDGGRLSEEEARALTASLKYFREAAPKHTADEEESLFPRLRSISSDKVQSALARVSELEKDHREAELLHEQVEQIGREWLAAGSLNHAEAREFREAVERLAGIYAGHIEVEDELVFPAASEALSAEAKAAVAREMAARRDVTSDSGQR